VSDDRKPDDANNQAAVSRREFGALSLGAGVAAMSGAQAAAAPALQLLETDVTVKTPDGTCDAAFIHPATGAYPGVLIWPDAFGLRPSMRGFARRIAAEGYAVLVPNPFYRTAKAPVFADPAKFDFANPADMAKLQAFTGPLNGTPGNAERDAVAGGARRHRRNEGRECSHGSGGFQTRGIQTRERPPSAQPSARAPLTSRTPQSATTFA
jgi:hypothetical protein